MSLFVVDLHQIEKETVVKALSDGPGFLIIKKVFCENLIERINLVMDQQLQQEKWDHSALKQTGERIWRFLDKHAFLSPSTFCDYYSNKVIHKLSEYWLGTDYHFTTQVNNINDEHGSMPAHFDYPLGMLSPQKVSQLPAHQIMINQFLSLQMVVAHSDMNEMNGGTKVWPGSQKLTYDLASLSSKELQNQFDSNAISCHLDKGDLLVLNPSLVHSAGKSSTSVKRRVVLHQVSSFSTIPIEEKNIGESIENIYRQTLSLLFYKKIDFEEAKNILKSVTRRTLYPFDFESMYLKKSSFLSEYEIFEKRLQRDTKEFYLASQ